MDEEETITDYKAQDLSNMRLDELICNLTTFKMKLDSNVTDKKKGIALNASYKEGEKEDLAETMSLIAKNFNKTMKRFNKKPYGSADTSKGNDRRFDNWKKARRIDGAGNSGFQQSKGKDEESDSEKVDTESNVNNFVAFTTVVSEEDSITPSVNDNHDIDSEDEEEVTNKELIANYQMFYNKWSKLTKAYTINEVARKELMKENTELLKTVADQKAEIGVLEGRVESMTKGIKMMNSNINILDEILEKGNRGKGTTGIGASTFRKYRGYATRGRDRVAFVPAQEKASLNQFKRERKRDNRWKCHNCGKKGHITPYCYTLYGKGRSRYSQPRKEWVQKSTSTVSHVVFTSLKASTWEGWYLDSGCSRHMTGRKSNLTNIKELSGNYVTFGGGAKGKITGKGTLKVEGLPDLQDVLLVDGLTVNLISISQLCDEGMKVIFSKDKCM
ncbi:hypothetical protein LIER_13627 [Lithospermum erythrorhizon]|uniref:CCHC-type domain-containing protein n=1 Tax=Lithospermum erythrorhizon TaxID=34254 RepID=A0AAV3PYC5_LITER